MTRIFTAQIDATSKLVVATNESESGLESPPSDRIFVVYNPAVIADPSGMYYVNYQFQNDPPS